MYSGVYLFRLSFIRGGEKNEVSEYFWVVTGAADIPQEILVKAILAISLTLASWNHQISREAPRPPSKKTNSYQDSLLHSYGITAARYNHVRPFKLSNIIIGALYLGSAGRVTSIGVIPLGTGPIFLSTLRCSDEDKTILDCSSISPLGIITSSCSHNQDVIVHCDGNNGTYNSKISPS